MMRRKLLVCLSIALFACAIPTRAAAQSRDSRFDAGVQVTTARSSEFERSDVGFGGRFGWTIGGPVAVEAEFNGYPDNFPDRVPISASRIEGLFGATVGPRIGRVRPFGKVRPGFVRFAAAPEPIACILIFPPPLSCTLASGRTMFALDLGGGAEIAMTPKTFLRIDAGDRLIKYPGPVFDSNRQARDTGFFSHDARIAFGGGVKF